MIDPADDCVHEFLVALILQVRAALFSSTDNRSEVLKRTTTTTTTTTAAAAITVAAEVVPVFDFVLNH